MKKTTRFISVLLSVTVILASFVPSAFAKEFAPKFDATNLGVNTQYLYEENDASWIRKLAIKEDMYSVGGIITEAELHPVTDYPYNTDAPTFKAEVQECVKTYTLDDDSQKAAYLYLLNQVGALTIISEPTTSNETKADWLRMQGIVITPEDELDTNKVLLISALYAMMRNDLYYVYKGEHYTIPEGTPLEEAVVLYITALSGNQNSLLAFIAKHFGVSQIPNLEDYVYYTSLMALYTNGYVSMQEITTLPRKEVFRRLTIMTIRNYGLAVDAETASTEELRQKYLTAMLGTHYRVSLDPDSLIKSRSNQGIPYYVLQKMGSQDAGLTISANSYTYEKCFDLVLKKTDRFDLENEFYSDIHEYNVYLNNQRTKISINPTPLMSTARISINDTDVVGGQYTSVELRDIGIQSIIIESVYKFNSKQKAKSTYKINIIQGTTPPEDSDLTGIIPTYGETEGNTYATDENGNIILTLPSVSGILPQVSGVNGIASNLAGRILSLNDKGQLVDQYGNIVSAGTHEQLPEGYKYVLSDDGIIQVVLMDTTEAPTGEGTTGEESEITGARKNIIVISSAICGLLLAGIIITLIVIKKKDKKSDPESVRNRRKKELAKKAKREAKESKKKQS